MGLGLDYMCNFLGEKVFFPPFIFGVVHNSPSYL